MSFGKLGQIQKMVYASKNFVSGLTNIQIKILRPNGALHQQGTMSEYSEAGFEGVYFFDVETNSVDPAGDYAVSIVSPSESHKVKSKINFIGDIGGGSDQRVSELELLIDLRAKPLRVQFLDSNLVFNIKNKSAEIKTFRRNAFIKFSKPSFSIEAKKPMIKINIDCRS